MGGMRLAEFKALWVGNYTQEQKESYKIMYGDNERDWPETDDEEFIVIDLERVCRFNPHHHAGVTTVELCGGYSFALRISYEKFKVIMSWQGNAFNYTNQ